MALIVLHVVRKLTPCFTRRWFFGTTGGILWQRQFDPGNSSAGAPLMAILSPSGNVALPLGEAATPNVSILSGLDGSTLRTDPIPVGGAGVYRSLGDSYYVITGNFATRVQYRDKNGYLFGFASTTETFDRGGVDANGRLLGINERNAFGQFVPRLNRELGGLEQFINLAGVVDASIRDVDVASESVVAAGQSQLNNGNIQGRVTLVKQAFEVMSDTFAYRNGQILSVGAPGFLANDSAWSTGTISHTQPVGGTVTLNPDRSFTFTPNVGFFEDTSFTYTVRVGTTTKSAVVLLRPMKVMSIDVPVDEVVGGTNLIGKVVLSTPNPFHNLVVQLNDTIQGLVVTSSIRIAQGSNEGTFNIITVPVAADSTGNITARLDNVTTTRAFTVKRAVPIGLTLNPSALVGGKPFVGAILMNGKAPSGGYLVNVTHSGTDLSVPFNVTVPANADSVNFNGTTIARSTSVTRLLTATSGGVAVTANLTINPGGLFAFTITPTTVVGGVSANGRVQTAGIAPAGGTVVTMTKDGGNVSVPGTVTVPEGAQFKNFTMTTSAVTAPVTRTITATFGTIVKTATLTITP